MSVPEQGLYIDLLSQCRLFYGIEPNALSPLLTQLGAQRRQYAKNALLLRPEESHGRIGILLEGRAYVQREEYSGARTLLTELEPGDLFGEAFACAPDTALPPDICARASDFCAVLWLDFGQVLRHPSLDPAHKTALVSNMLAVLAEKDLLLSRRIGHLSKRSTREKLLSYLFEQSQRCGSSSFLIPFDRQALADYLCVDRSAMSAALSRLRAEGLIEYHRSQFTLTERFHELF